MNALELADHDANFVAGEHDGEPGGSPRAHQLVEPRHVAVEHVALEEEKGRERLILRRGAHVPLRGEGREEPGDLGGSHVDRWRAKSSFEKNPPFDRE